MSGTDAGDGDTQMQKFELYIKASAIDKETKGSCPICQQFFMITCLLGENQDDIDFKVFTVQADCPPKNFAAGWSKKYPVVMVNSGRNKSGQDISGMMYDTFEELETFFEGINKECPELKRKNAPNQLAMGVVENIYKYFNHFISGQSEKTLVAELRKLDEYLEGQDTKFLVDNVLCFSDCHLLPRLQHIRVAGKTYRDFDIPAEFKHVWKYLKNAYDQDAFKSTMPSDQDIVFHYEKKAGGPPRTGGRGRGRATLEKFTYTMDVPADVLNGLNGTSAETEEAATQQEPEAPAQEPVPEPEPEPELTTETVAPPEPEPATEACEPEATPEAEVVTVAGSATETAADVEEPDAASVADEIAAMATEDKVETSMPETPAAEPEVAKATTVVVEDNAVETTANGSASAPVEAS